MNAHKPKVLVCGNVNMDVVVQTDQLPERGQNLRCSNLKILPGGKAANQSVAAARLGADVTLLCCLGEDEFSKTAYDNLSKEGVNLSYIQRSADSSCGTAVVLVDGKGENRILSYLGANQSLTPDHIETARAAIEGADVVLLQLGVPKLVVEKVITIAKQAKVPVILDPTPFGGWLPNNWFDTDFLIPNETEFSAICKLQGVAEPFSSGADLRQSFSELSKKGLKQLILKLGADGCLLFQDGVQHVIPAIRGLRVVDTTGAGDTFAGAFATEWVRTSKTRQAIEFAVRAAGLATTKIGAQSAMPDLKTVESLNL